MYKFNFKINKRKLVGNALTLALVFLAVTPVFAAGGGGAGAISNAANTIKGYKTNVQNLIYAIAAVVAFIGAIRIYNKWNNGDQDINKELMAYGGACLFLFIVPSFITAFFG